MGDKNCYPVVERDGYTFARVPNDDRMIWAGVPQRFARVTWKTVDRPPNEKVAAELEWLSQWSRNDGILTVVLVGPPGRGKTTIAAAVTNRFLPLSPIWESWPTLVRKVTESWKDGGEGHVLNPVKSRRFAVIDDFGKELTEDENSHAYQWQCRVAYEVVNARYVQEIPTLITTELTPGQLAQRLDQAVASRLQECARWINLSSLEDRRLRASRR